MRRLIKDMLFLCIILAVCACSSHRHTLTTIDRAEETVTTETTNNYGRFEDYVREVTEHTDSLYTEITRVIKIYDTTTEDNRVAAEIEEKITTGSVSSKTEVKEEVAIETDTTTMIKNVVEIKTDTETIEEEVEKEAGENNFFGFIFVILCGIFIGYMIRAALKYI